MGIVKIEDYMGKGPKPLVGNWESFGHPQTMAPQNVWRILKTYRSMEIWDKGVTCTNIRTSITRTIREHNAVGLPYVGPFTWNSRKILQFKPWSGKSSSVSLFKGWKAEKLDYRNKFQDFNYATSVFAGVPEKKRSKEWTTSKRGKTIEVKTKSYSTEELISKTIRGKVLGIITTKPFTRGEFILEYQGKLLKYSDAKKQDLYATMPHVGSSCSFLNVKIRGGVFMQLKIRAIWSPHKS